MRAQRLPLDDRGVVVGVEPLGRPKFPEDDFGAQSDAAEAIEVVDEVGLLREREPIAEACPLHDGAALERRRFRDARVFSWRFGSDTAPPRRQRARAMLT